MNALCNCSHDVTLLLVGNEYFCSFIELQEMIKNLIVTHYMNQEQNALLADGRTRYSMSLKRLSGSILV